VAGQAGRADLDFFGGYLDNNFNGSRRVHSSEPELQPQRVHSIEIVSEQPLITHEAQVLVKPQGRLVPHLRLQHHLVGIVSQHCLKKGRREMVLLGLHYR